MTQALYLAIRSLWWHRGRSLILIASLALTIWLPLTVRLALRQFQDEIALRAGSTPLVLGAVGSRMELMNLSWQQPFHCTFAFELNRVPVWMECRLWARLRSTSSFGVCRPRPESFRRCWENVFWVRATQNGRD